VVEEHLNRFRADLEPGDGLGDRDASIRFLFGAATAASTCSTSSSVRRTACPGEPAGALLAAAAADASSPKVAATATIIVVGRSQSHGRHVAGSVSETVIHTSEYPVIAVP